MTEIQQGMIVKTSAGVTGKVLRVVSAPGAVYYRLARVIVCASGRIIETAQRAFVADSEVIAFRAMPAQPVAMWKPAQTTAQLIASARDAFEIAMEPVEAEYAEQPAPVTVVTPAARDERRTMHNPAAFVGKHVDSTKWIIPAGYERCAMTGKLHAEADLERTFFHYAFPKAFLVANGIYVEDAAWLSDEGYDLIEATLDRLGLLEAYRAWFDGDMQTVIAVEEVTTLITQVA